MVLAQVRVVTVVKAGLADQDAQRMRHTEASAEEECVRDRGTGPPWYRPAGPLVSVQ